MKAITAYATLLALGTVERNDELKKLSKLGDKLTNQKTEAQKLTAKILVAMEAKGECQKGEFKAHAKAILGRDIREVFQDVYGLINVFRAVMNGEMDGLTETDFDTMDSSKLARLSTFMGDKHGHLLPKAIEAAKNGTAGDMRKLKPKAEKSAGSKAPEDQDPKTTTIPVGFAATDIGPEDPITDSKQFRDRLMRDTARCKQNRDTELAENMLNFLGRGYFIACDIAGVDPLELLTDLAAKMARPATAKPVDAELAAA